MLLRGAYPTALKLPQEWGVCSSILETSGFAPHPALERFARADGPSLLRRLDDQAPELLDVRHDERATMFLDNAGFPSSRGARG